MVLKKIVTLTCLATCLAALPLVYAAGPVVGVAVSQGRMEVDRAVVDGNAGLTSGASIRTDAVPTRIQLINGSRATLGVESEARVYADRLVLERGGGLLATGRMDAKGFQIVPVGDSKARVDMIKGNVVQVAALNGPVNVTDAAGVLIAQVTPEAPLTFEPEEKKADTAKTAGQTAAKVVGETAAATAAVTATEVTVKTASKKAAQTASKKAAKTAAKTASKTAAKTAAETAAEVAIKTGLSTAATVGIGVGVTAAAAGVAVPLATISR